DYRSFLLHFLKNYMKDYPKYPERINQIAHNTVERILLCVEWDINKGNNKELLLSDSAEYKLAKTFKILVTENFLKKKGVRFYAEKLNVMTQSLARACKKIYGQSPKEIITDQIIIEAKRLLKYTNLNIKEIAY